VRIEIGLKDQEIRLLHCGRGAYPVHCTGDRSDIYLNMRPDLNNREAAVQAAIAEVLAPQWAHTKQLLSVNSVGTDEKGNPTPIRIDDESEPGTYFVYFPIRNEKYCLVVGVAPDESGRLAVSGQFMEAGVRVVLAIYSRTLSAADITKRLSLVPSSTHAIGDPIYKHNPAGRKHEQHIWCIQPQRDVPASVEEKLSNLLKHIEPAVEQIKAIRPACEIHVNIEYTGWGGMCQFGGYHMDDHVVQGFAAIGAEFDFDLYAMGPAMPEDDEQ
jgi:hypothetical protein